MLVSAQAAQDPVVAKIGALLIAAKPQLQADSKALARATSGKPYEDTEDYIDAGDAIAKMRKHLQSLRASVLAQTGGSAAATSARDLAAQTLLETDQALEKLAAATDSTEAEQATKLRDESMRLLSMAAATSVKAEAALGIPWPF